MIRGEIDGTAKAFIHNNIVVKVVEANGGELVKLIGDEVMAIFEGKEGLTNALRTAITCHQRLEEYNKFQDYNQEDIRALHTKTGIHNGLVFLFEPMGKDKSEVGESEKGESEKNGIPDPYGSVVDIAARLTALAKDDQILCSGKVKNQCQDKKIKFGNPVLRAF